MNLPLFLVPAPPLTRNLLNTAYSALVWVPSARGHDPAHLCMSCNHTHLKTLKNSCEMAKFQEASTIYYSG